MLMIFRRKPKVYYIGESKKSKKKLWLEVKKTFKEFMFALFILFIFGIIFIVGIDYLLEKIMILKNINLLYFNYYREITNLILYTPLVAIFPILFAIKAIIEKRKGIMAISIIATFLIISFAVLIAIPLIKDKELVNKGKYDVYHTSIKSIKLRKESGSKRLDSYYLDMDNGETFRISCDEYYDLEALNNNVKIEIKYLDNSNIFLDYSIIKN